MPTYEYACTQCGQHLEAVQSFTDEPLTTCPNCGGALRKVFGAVGIVFKGSGFYKTDSRPSSSNGGSAKKTEGEASSTTQAKTEPASGGGESAPAPASSTPAAPAAPAKSSPASASS